MLDSDGGLLRGTLDLLILKALPWEPRHGYAVADWIHLVTDEDLLVEEGPLYTALHRLEKQGWLTSSWGFSENNRRARYYTLTPAGCSRKDATPLPQAPGGRDGGGPGRGPRPRWRGRPR